MIKATIVADSISAHTGQRITTFELDYPRFIHAEMLTHRQFSRNSASSRAIPIDKMIELVETNTATPIYWGLNQAGMQAKKEHDDMGKELSMALWLKAKDYAVGVAKELQSLGLHKQIVNRVLEPFQMIKVLVTATNYDNFFNLRCHKDAQPEIKHLADLMYQAMQKSIPEVLKAGEWHTPYVHHYRNENGELEYYVLDKNYKEFLSKDDAIKVSCSCSAQISYRNNDTSLRKAISIYDKLVNSSPVHASAFEHCATPIDGSVDEELGTDTGITHFLPYNGDSFTPCSGNFVNWVQYRQLIPNHVCKEYKV